jgi:hypothetical protein
MTDQEHLERAYRRRLAWYPRAFRDEHGPEILAVLMAGARDGQRRPGLAGSADLIRSGAWMRLRPSAPRSAPTVRAAVWLMCAGAAITAGNLIITLAYILADIGGLEATLRQEHPSHTAAQISQQYTIAVTMVPVTLLVAIALWLWMARVTGQGQHWARKQSTQLFGLATLKLISGFGFPGIHVGSGPGGLTGGPAPSTDGRTRAASILQSTDAASGMSRADLRARGHRAAGRRGGPAAGSRRRAEAAERGRGDGAT